MGQDKSVLEKLMERAGPKSQIPVVMAMDAIMAGIDTTGSTLAFLLYDLAVNPDHQEKLYNEIVEVVGERGRVTEARLKKLSHLKACFQESQRMKPAVSTIARVTQQDMVLGGYQVPRGKVALIMMSHTMMQEDNFDNSRLFQPERWLRGSPTYHNAHPFAALPFGFGPRMCIGRRFAELEVFIVVIKLLQKFRLEYHHEPIGVDTQAVVKPDTIWHAPWKGNDLPYS